MMYRFTLAARIGIGIGIGIGNGNGNEIGSRDLPYEFIPRRRFHPLDMRVIMDRSWLFGIDDGHDGYDGYTIHDSRLRTRFCSLGLEEKGKRHEYRLAIEEDVPPRFRRCEGLL